MPESLASHPLSEGAKKVTGTKWVRSMLEPRLRIANPTSRSCRDLRVPRVGSGFLRDLSARRIDEFRMGRLMLVHHDAGPTQLVDHRVGHTRKLTAHCWSDRRK